MFVDCDLQRLEKTLRDFMAVTGIGVDILRGDFTLILQRYGRQWNARCPLMEEKGICGNNLRRMLHECGEKRMPGTYVCPEGFAVLIVPLVQMDAVVGYILLGPMRTEEDPAKKRCPGRPVWAETLQQYGAELPKFGSGKRDSLIAVADMLASYIRQEGILVLNYRRSMETVVNYINHNLDQPLSVQSIVEHTHISKSVLYKITHEHFHCTLGELILRKKAEEAVRMLLGTDRTVEEIAQILAFSSASYFGRVFKKVYGVTPHRYRRQNRTEE